MPGALQTFSAPLPTLGETREVQVWMPSGALESDEPLPVAYLLDGQNVFDPAAPYGGWQAARAGEALAAEGLNLLLVAVPHGERRIDEYTFGPDARYGGGQGEVTLTDLVESVIPWVARSFSTCLDSRGTALVGSSLGGLFALSAGLRRPDVFGFLGVLSPSVWWAGRAALRDVAAVRPSTEQTYHLTTGEAEGDTPQAAAKQMEDVRALFAALSGAGARGSLTLTPGGHNEGTWAAQLPDVLRAFAAHAGERG